MVTPAVPPIVVCWVNAGVPTPNANAIVTITVTIVLFFITFTSFSPILF
jgi:hypothetical protein